MFAEMRRKVADTLKKRNVRSMVYFHCDHFEPWRGFQGDVSEKNVDDILNFCRTLENVDYAKKLTLFYKCNNYICISQERKQLRAPGDEIGFAISTDREVAIAKVAMEHIAHRTGHEIQVHYHHEFFTGNDKYCLSMPETREFFKTRNTPELDGRRWEVGLSLALDTIRLEANIPLEKWFFVHGNWALNGSDRDVCTITDEMQRLQKLGCLGDFTFPAGRPHCDPRYEKPVFVQPVKGFKSYDLPEADAVPAYGNREAVEQGKFFIWSSAINARASSIDYYSAEVRKRCEDVAQWVDEIAEKAVIEDGTMFIKTHSHSMYRDYFEAARRPIPPHLYPGVQNLLCTLFDGAAEADIEVAFETAGEVYGRFIGEPVAPPMKAIASTPSISSVPVSVVAPEPTVVSPVPPMASPELVSSPPSAPPLPLWDVLVPADAPALVSSKDIGELAYIVNDVSLAVMRERVKALGTEGAGSYAYYDALIKSGEMLQPYELRIADYLIENLTPDDVLVEVGCGLGTLVLLLASAGHASFGIEGDSRRLASFRAIRDDLAARVSGIRENSHVVPGFFPDGAVKVPRNGAILFTNTVSGLDLDKQRAIIAAAAEYTWILFDAQRFFVKRTADEEMDQLLGMFVDAGLSRPVPVLDLGESGQYYRTQRKSAKHEAKAPSKRKGRAPRTA